MSSTPRSSGTLILIVLLSALGLLAIVIGAIVLGSAMFGSTPDQAAALTPTPVPSNTATATAVPTEELGPSATPIFRSTPTATATPTVTPTPSITPTLPPVELGVSQADIRAYYEQYGFVFEPDPNGAGAALVGTRPGSELYVAGPADNLTRVSGTFHLPDNDDRLVQMIFAAQVLNQAAPDWEDGPAWFDKAFGRAFDAVIAGPTEYEESIEIDRVRTAGLQLAYLDNYEFTLTVTVMAE
jgi:hypothetical protein